MSENPSAETDLDHLGLFLQFADTVQAAWERAHRPVYAETCACGGSVEVGREATPAERRRIQAAFYGRHRECPERLYRAGSPEQ